ncbi:hypothetical protein C8F04DRAFT_1200383 [Mycena alexandri]|uniref:Uncharacterized protein n=1 Tax=Mycena alexandri TaxID=1745969 RepID=A0AAD6RY32_9AGAR|nr:hypothetical protein C8F04DRAFT_1200383 [Mycena alexandri]
MTQPQVPSLVPCPHYAAHFQQERWSCRSAFYSSRRRDWRTTAELLGLTAADIAADAQAWNNAAAATTTPTTMGGNLNGSQVFGSWGSLTADYTPTTTGWDLPTASRENQVPWGTWTAEEWAKWHGGSMAGWPPAAAAGEV